jgi:hypothetical protein
MPIREFRYSFESQDGSVEHEAACIAAFCEGAVLCNLEQIASNPDDFPCCIVEADLRYIPPPHCKPSMAGAVGCQQFRGIVPLLRAGFGTCIDLACAQTSLFRFRGVASSVLASPQAQVQGPYHTVVSYHGGIYDPEIAVKQHIRCDACKGV